MTKLTCERDQFAKAFQTVAGVAGSVKGTHPVLSNVRVRREDRNLVFYATDSELSMSCAIPCETCDPGFDVLLPVGRFQSMISESNAETLVIDDGETIRIELGLADYELPTAKPEEFPITKPTTGKQLTLNARGLRRALQQTNFCTDMASNRYQLSGVYFDVRDCKASFVATDGRRLAHSFIAANEDYAMTGIIPQKATKAMIGICDQEGHALIVSDLNSITVFVGGCTLTSRLVEGRYPNWRLVVPDVTRYTNIPFQADMLGSGLRQAAIVSDKETRGVDMVFTAGEVTLQSATAESGRSKVSLPVAYEGDQLAMRIDYKFAGDFCRAVDSGSTIEVLVHSPSSPMMFRSGDGYEYVVMPMASI